MSSHTPSSATVLDVFNTLSSPGIPLTTTEVADEFDCTARTIYNKLDALVEEGAIETKKVGARGRVWWRPPPEYDRQPDHEVNFHRTDEPEIPSYESVTDIPSGGEMGKRIREKDWAKTSLGPIDEWPQKLRVGVEIMLGASEATGIYWGSDFTFLYNDAWRKLIGDKHPDALGQPAQEVFAERWETIRSMFERVMSGTGVEEKRKPFLAFNYEEGNKNTWFDYSFSPISGTDGSIEGIFNVAVEVTKHKQAQEELQKQAVLDTFRVELTDELRSIVDPIEIQATAGHLLGEQLEASLSYYYQYDAEVGSGVVHRDYRRDGGDSIAGRYTLEEFPTAHKLVSDGDPLVITDIPTDTRLTATDRDNFDALDFRSSVFVPLVKDGQLVAVFSVGQSTPREWTDTEIAMVEETAERTWAVVERANAEQALRESEGRYRTLFESIDEGYCIIEVLFDEDEVPVDYRFLETNPVFEEQTGLVDTKEKSMRELEPRHEEHWFETYGRIALTGEPERFTNEAKYLDERWYDVYAFRIGEPEERKVAILFNDISDRKHTQLSLERLNDASRELMTADTQEITERAADITQRVLGLDYTALWDYNEGTGELQPTTTVTTRKIESETIRYPDDFSEQVWQTFISEDGEICTNLSSVPENSTLESPLRSNVLIPLGRKGVIYAGSMDPETFDETTVDLARTLAATLKTALERAEGEQQLAQQNRDLAYLDQLYSLMWKIDQKLVQAGSVESIDRAVCEQLADSDLFEFAWVGEFDAITNTINPRQWAGIDGSYLDDRTITIDENATNHDPVADAVSTRESQIVADVATDKRLAASRETILARGARSCISVPLVFEDILYGVLTVFATQLQPHERNQRVLDELGRTVAHAINAAQKEETVKTDNIVELTIQFQKPETVLSRLARNADVKLQFKGIVPIGNDSSYVFFTGSRTSADEIHVVGRNLPAITTITRVAENDETCMFRATVSGSTLVSQLATQKDAVRALTFDRNAAVAVVDLPSTTDVRPFVDELQNTYGSVKIMSQRSRDRSPESVQDVQMAIKEPLTERQAGVLKLAYLSGFFESPRESTGQEIADLLDVSPPTFTQHLRAAERKVFALAFNEE